MPARGITRMVASLLIGVGLAAAGLGLHTYPPLDSYPWRLLLLGAGTGVGLWLLCLAVALAVRRLRAKRSHAVLFRPMVALALLVVGAGGTAAANGALDPHGARAYETRVVAKVTSRSAQGPTSAVLRVEDFRPGHEGEVLSLSPGEVFEAVKEGDPILVLAGRGLVDWWLAGLRRPGNP